MQASEYEYSISVDGVATDSGKAAEAEFMRVFHVKRQSLAFSYKKIELLVKYDVGGKDTVRATAYSDGSG